MKQSFQAFLFLGVLFFAGHGKRSKNRQNILLIKAYPVINTGIPRI
jgi:hypothetical protein